MKDALVRFVAFCKTVASGEMSSRDARRRTDPLHRGRRCLDFLCCFSECTNSCPSQRYPDEREREREIRESRGCSSRQLILNVCAVSRPRGREKTRFQESESAVCESGRRRAVCLEAPTTTDELTYSLSWPARLQLMLLNNDPSVVVRNFGVSGSTALVASDKPYWELSRGRRRPTNLYVDSRRVDFLRLKSRVSRVFSTTPFFPISDVGVWCGRPT